jgi:hypothetical protein
MSMTDEIESMGINFGRVELSRHPNLLKQPDRVWTEYQAFALVIRTFWPRSLTIRGIPQDS